MAYPANGLSHFVKGINPLYEHGGFGENGNSFIADLMVTDQGFSNLAKYQYAMTALPQSDLESMDAVFPHYAVRGDILGDGFIPNPNAKVAALLNMCRRGGNIIFIFFFHIMYTYNIYEY